MLTIIAELIKAQKCSTNVPTMTLCTRKKKNISGLSRQKAITLSASGSVGWPTALRSGKSALVFLARYFC